MMGFKDKIKELRQEKGLSQQAVADSIYVSRSAVAKWENGLGLPSKESLSFYLNFIMLKKTIFSKNKFMRKN